MPIKTPFNLVLMMPLTPPRVFRGSLPPHLHSFSQFSTIHFVCPQSLSWCVNEHQAGPWNVFCRLGGNSRMWALKSGVFVVWKTAFHHRSVLGSKWSWRKRLQCSVLCTESLLLCFPSQFLISEMPHAKRRVLLFIQAY